MVPRANARLREFHPLKLILARRYRAMVVNPNPRLGGNRAHTETTVLGLLKKSQQDRAPAFERHLPDQLMGCSGLCPLDPINLNISTERAQGHFLSPWSKSGAFYRKEPRYSLCVYQYGSRGPTAGVSKKSLTFS
jgi:hypothetical protein